MSNKMSKSELMLLKNGYVAVPAGIRRKTSGIKVSTAAFGTVLANMAYYGFAPSEKLVRCIASLTSGGISEFWGRLEESLGLITGDSLDMSAHVVYKNFPRETLEMSEAGYWIRQIFMYVGFPNELFTQPAEAREPLDERLCLKILDLAEDDAYEKLVSDLVASGASWNIDQRDAMSDIVARKDAVSIDLSSYGFRSNGVWASVFALSAGLDPQIKTTSATDVLRIAAGLSSIDKDVSIRLTNMELATSPKFKAFSRAMRRRFVTMLEGCVDIEGDFARRREIWKRLLSRLHPGDYKAPRVQAAYADLYGGSKDRLTARLERGYAAKDPATLDLLEKNPGVFMRDLHRAYGVFHRDAFDRFEQVLDDLSVEQLLKVAGYFEDEDQSLSLIRPKGNWSKAQSVTREKPHVSQEDRNRLVSALRRTVGERVDDYLPEGVALDETTFSVTLPTNGQELATYGRGTEFDIPENARFLRTASYWENPSARNTWFDNGWNFFAADWSELGSCCWDSERFGPYDKSVGAIFSGDPTNSKDLEGRACQMIDLYLDKLEDMGVAYAVWNVLCYSHVAFDEAKKVFATLQWGENPQKGKLYEPARAQMMFPLQGKNMTKFVAYIDIKRRKLVYMDADFPGRVSSASGNGTKLSELMPAFQAYARRLPTVGHLFGYAAAGSVPIVKSDANIEIDGRAWVFNRERAENNIDEISLTEILALKGRDVDKLLEKRHAA